MNLKLTHYLTYSAVPNPVKILSLRDAFKEVAISEQAFRSKVIQPALRLPPFGNISDFGVHKPLAKLPVTSLSMTRLGFVE